MASSGSEHPSGGSPARDAGHPAGAVRTRRPLIGLTTYRERAVTGVWDTEFALLHNAYVDAVARRGVPVLLPPQEHGADEAIDGVDALVLTGGSDVDPERYQQRPHAGTIVVRPWRDDWNCACLPARSRPACPCSASAGARSCSTWPSAGRLTSTSPTPSAIGGTARPPVSSVRPG